jgi:RNA polymerase sigma factor (sigma-70 family)
VSDQELIAALKKGDAAAFRSLVDLHGSHVYNTSLGIVQHTEDAEDITQEVFIEVFRSIQSFRGDSALSTWIYRIAVRKSLEFLRKKKSRSAFSFLRIFSGEEESHAAQSPFYHPGLKLENKERAAILFQAIDRLPENQKTAFVLNQLEHLTYKEIAEVMELSVPAVESLLVRARQKLRDLLSDYYEKNEK